MPYGGIKTNEKAQVIDTSDNPVRGFYAAGEITGGYFYHNYPSGTGLTRGAVMARIAAADAVEVSNGEDRRDAYARSSML